MAVISRKFHEEVDGRWAGWEYEVQDGLHMYVSKRHYFLNGSDRAVCGVTPPPCGARSDEGNDPCMRCKDWVDKQKGNL